jgi:NAD(P)-dependent dehydrogenase (short-subunit alcohol dehydrogenase family)/acyl carrier protein
MERTGTWLVFADESGFASTLIARLESAGHDVITVRAGEDFQQTDSRTFTIEPTESHRYDSLIRTLQSTKSLPDRIVHAWSIAGNPSAQLNGDRFTPAQALGFYSLLFLARALAAHNVGHDIELFTLSNNVHEVCGSETLCPEKATLLGPCMVIRQEYPNLRVKSIDLDATEFSGGHESAADLVIGEFLDPDSSLFVAYRNSRRWVQTYEPVVPGSSSHSRSSFREGGVYLITGGLGSIGIAISEYLATTYRARLVLVGRSRLPTRECWNDWMRSHQADDPASVRITAIERIERLGGEVLFMNASVADAAAIRRVIEETYQHFGALHGVIHAAGIVGDDGYLEIKDSHPDRCEGHFQTKAHGLLALEELLDGKELDFCLLMSSLTSVLGGIGQAAYASANIYMDAFARRHNRTSPVPWLSVNWDVWRLEHTTMDSGRSTTLKELGMNAAEAMAMMETVLALKSAGQLVVSTGDLGARIDQWIRLKSLNAGSATTAANPNRSAPPKRSSRRTNHDSPRDETEQQIARIWQEALGLDEVGIHDNFAQLGGHSLLAIRIVSELRRAFQIDLPMRALFDAPTIAELSRCIKGQIITEIEALTDEEARQLVSTE